MMEEEDAWLQGRGVYDSSDDVGSDGGCSDLL